MRNKIIIVLLVLSGSLFGNSIFSFYGLPNQFCGNDVYGLGMGETGCADLFRMNQNISNPSAMTTSNKVIYSTAASMGYMWYYDDLDNTFRDDGLALPYFTVVVPIKSHRFGFNFNMVYSGNLENEELSEWTNSTGDTLEYNEINRVSSNVYKADLSYAIKNPYFNLGVSFNYYFGHKIRYWKLDFDDTDYTDTKYEIEKTFKNPGFSAGISKKIGNISLGAAYTMFTELKGESTYKYGHSPYVDTLGLADDILYEIPNKFAGGITWKFTEKYKVSFDGQYEMWEDTDIYNENTYKFGLGFAYDPLSGYGKWFERIPLRFGGYVRKLPFRKNEEDIMEKAVTLGLSIPLKSPNTKIEFAAKYLTRGDKDIHGIGDRSFMITIGISGFDVFKKKHKKNDHRDIPKADRR
ncbi:MAG: hypothetical protein K8R49_05885 [Candidatus Cloacimonetes bacterium]|nr:hypothetical protein [Candidatus Cloacimonadota bacterium]